MSVITEPHKTAHYLLFVLERYRRQASLSRLVGLSVCGASGGMVDLLSASINKVPGRRGVGASSRVGVLYR
jgi:hypothetical protein